MAQAGQPSERTGQRSGPGGRGGPRGRRDSNRGNDDSTGAKGETVEKSRFYKPLCKSC